METKQGAIVSGAIAAIVFSSLFIWLTEALGALLGYDGNLLLFGRLYPESLDFWTRLAADSKRFFVSLALLLLLFALACGMWAAYIEQASRKK